jgi:competence protein ComEC
MQAHFIDMGQANATLLEFPCGAVLIDAGAEKTHKAPALVAYLDAFFDQRADLNRKLDAVFITHNHKDHTNALEAVDDFFTIARLIHSGQSTESGAGPVNLIASAIAHDDDRAELVMTDDLVTGAAGGRGYTDEIVNPLAKRCGDMNVDIRVLSGALLDNPGWPDKEFNNANNHSLVIRVDYSAKGEQDPERIASFLFTGDLETDGIESMLEWYGAPGGASNVLDVDVYHVGHHGSGNATTKELLEAMTPLYSVISTGKCFESIDAKDSFNTWAYRHPHEAAVDLVVSQTTRKRAKQNVIVGRDKKNFDKDKVRFAKRTIEKAVFATSWNGNIVLRAGTSGSIDVVEAEVGTKWGPTTAKGKRCFAPAPSKGKRKR